MGKRPKRKVVLFLVEGQSDINALQYAISQFYEELDEAYEVHFPTLQDDNQNGGDITSKHGIKPENIEKCINKLFLDKFLQNEGLYPKDIMEIVQIVDLDGAYIPDEDVVQREESESDMRTLYLEDCIEANDMAAIIKRNARKRENLNCLMAMNTIKVKSKTIKYSVYYFSSNLDHYLHGNANINSRDKCSEADKFSMRCMDDINVFIDAFTKDEGITAGMTYIESWDYIKQERNSLERHTNLNVLIERIMAEATGNK